MQITVIDLTANKLPGVFVSLLLFFFVLGHAACTDSRPVTEAIAAAETSRRLPTTAAVASAHPLATQAGTEILEMGGNAFDAAVAVSAALGVVEPYSSGLGGGGFYLLHRESDQMQIMIDGREVAPMAATHDMYLDEKGDPIPRLSVDGPMAAGIPGLPAALVHIADKYGRLSLEQSLAPAIRYAQDGYPVTPRLRLGLQFKRDLIAASEAASQVFLRDGQVPELGTVIKQPALGETLRLLTKNGADGFYRGELAQKLVTGNRDAGGIWTLEDLAGYRVIERPPVVAEYKGVRVVTAPPPSSGGVVLVNTLNILSTFDLENMDPMTAKHLLIESMRRSYRDRAEYLGDPDFVDIPMRKLLHPYYAAGQRISIRFDRATPSDLLPGILPAGSGGTDTTHFSILDKEGNRVGGTQSINFWFGSGFMPPDTGVLLNNEMDDFSLKPGVPNGYELVGADANAIAPGKRMLSSMTPTFLESERGIAILGTPGGSRIISMVLLSSLAWVDGADAKEMVELRRFHHQYLPDQIFYEPGAMSESEKRSLQERGHELKESERLYGNMQAITWDFETGVVRAASDPRGEGEGLVY